ncbi:DUF4878 domain-containing protein [Suttonella ornithocola]|uniref:Lumazine-binding domain n=1 Tax=Suttonella ornithocola TaxID=279832 RepID=A0A380MXC0_9GAMM|nr:DUF4878 domain-containing protein [Suttonella ornithocola]SUO97225.1 Lumazine-binding domain [Suttonella ornithocola]
MKKIIHLLLLSTVITFLVACGGKDKPAEIAEIFFKEMFQGDASKAVALVDTSGNYLSEKEQQQANMFIAMMAAGMKTQIEKAGGIKSIEAGKVEYNQDKTTATVPLTITLNKAIDGKNSDTNNIHLKKVNGDWKIVIR